MWAFSDESERSGVMSPRWRSSTPVTSTGLPGKLRALLLAGQRQVHTAKEAPRRRRALLDAVGTIDGLSVTVLRYRRPPGTDRTAGRHLLLQAGAGLVVGSGVT